MSQKRGGDVLEDCGVCVSFWRFNFYFIHKNGFYDEDQLTSSSSSVGFGLHLLRLIKKSFVKSKLFLKNVWERDWIFRWDQARKGGNQDNCSSSEKIFEKNHKGTPYVIIQNHR